MAAANLMRRIGTAVGSRTSGGWYDPQMPAASCAVAERIPLVDFVFEVRDARDEKDMGDLTETRLLALHVRMDFSNDASTKVASKLLNLYLTGRIGYNTLDSLPVNTQ